MRVGEVRNGRKLVAYAVYNAPDGSDLGFYGYTLSIAEAIRLIRSGRVLPASLFDTARLAGSCAGLFPPGLEAGEEEDVEPFRWLTNEDCICRVWKNQQT